jgi:hypothetical protein
MMTITEALSTYWLEGVPCAETLEAFAIANKVRAVAARC